VALDRNLIDRRRGAILGLAIGDALGAAVEFQPAGSFPEVSGFRAGGPHGLEPGEWTDDTSMALPLAASIAEVGWDLNDQAQRTTGADCGQLTGAGFGESAIPAEWRQGLAGKDQIEPILQRLIQ
jgi:ADP-ribosylglycohydrolase